jgi:hypothetical protein
MLQIVGESHIEDPVVVTADALQEIDLLFGGQDGLPEFGIVLVSLSSPLCVSPWVPQF